MELGNVNINGTSVLGTLGKPLRRQSGYHKHSLSVDLAV